MRKEKSRNIVLKIIASVFLFFFIIMMGDSVKAEYSCSYGVSDKPNFPFVSYSVLNDNEIEFSLTLKIGEPMDFPSNNTYIMDFYLDEEYVDLSNSKQIKKLIQYFNGRCQKTIYYCHGKGHTHVGLAPTDVNKHEVDRQGILFAQQYQGEANTFNGQMLPFDYGDNNNNIVDDDYINFSGDNGCVSLELVNSSNAEVVDFLSYDCSFLIKYFKGNDDIKSLKSYYDLCKKGNSDACLVYNNNKNIIKTYCYSTIEHSDYNNPCVYECSEGVSKKIGEIESSFNGKTCHLSDKIIKFAANILKWGKYFAPALVIILSLLDFVKALAAQNDDDMKKSQARFIKRLISAVLLFIIPMLIYFVLDKFNLINADPFCKLI